MVGRRETRGRRLELMEDLRQGCRDGTFAAGSMLPTMRELQRKYSLAPSTVLLALRGLADEGLVRSEPRVGFFVTAPPLTDHTFLMAVPPAGSPWTSPFIERMRLGFEDQISELGGASLCIDLGHLDSYLGEPGVPSLAGVFFANADPDVDPYAFVGDSVPVVRTWNQSTQPLPGGGNACPIDTVYMDNVAGGREATRHLAERGHRRIAFLGVHGSDPQSNNDTSAMVHRWSELRAEGWQNEMAARSEGTDRMLFLPEHSPLHPTEEVAAAKEAAATILMRRDITAVVCANDNAATALLTVLREHDVPRSGWPTIIGFDGNADVQNRVLTSLRLPWEQIGSRAARLLADRISGELTGPGRQHLLPMTVVPRLGSSRPRPEAEAALAGTRERS